MATHNPSISAAAVLTASAAQWPEKVAVIDQRGTCSYRELFEAANAVKLALSQSGAKPGAVVGASLDDARTFLATLFGVLYAECVFIPVAPNLSAAEQQRVISETGIERLVSTADFQATLPKYAHTPSRELTIFLEVHLRLHEYTTHRTRSVTDLFPDAAVIRYTSGTTARSKGVVLSHAATVARAHTSIGLIGVTPSDIVLTLLPLSYHYIASAVAFIKAGSTIIDCAQLSPSEVLRTGRAYSATLTYASPYHYAQLCTAHAATDSREKGLPCLRRAISTSALLSGSTAELMTDLFGIRPAQAYGIIEVGLPLWNNTSDMPPAALGRCAPPYECQVLGDDGAILPDGEVGELAIRGPGLFSGYLLGAEGAEPHNSLHWFLTGDLVSKDPSGLVTYRGRKRSVINCGGHKVFPEEVEEILRRAPGVNAVRIVGESHPESGSSIIAEIVPTNVNEPLSSEDLRAFCLQELSPHKVPSEFRLVRSLPRTGSGKLVRH